MTNMLDLCDNTQLNILHMLKYQDILQLITAYAHAKEDPIKLFYFLKILRHVLVLEPKHQTHYLSTPLNGALPFHQLSLEMQYHLNYPCFENPQGVIDFMCQPEREEEKKYYIENYLYFNSKFKNQRIKNQWLKQILESEFNFQSHPEILIILAHLYSKNDLSLTWNTVHQIQFRNLTTKTIFFLHIIRNVHHFSHRRNLILQFVNSNMDFEYKRLFFNLGLDVHLYSAAKAHVEAFFDPQSHLSMNEQRILVDEALKKPILNLAFLILFKNHPFYTSLLPNQVLEKHYAWIEKLDIKPRLVFNTLDEFDFSINYQKYEEPEETGEEMASLHGFIILNTFMSLYQDDHWKWSGSFLIRKKVIAQFGNHSHPAIAKYLKHVLYEMASDIRLKTEMIIQQIEIKNDPYSDLHAYLFLKLHLRQFNQMLSWLDINRFSNILLKIYSSGVNDKYLTWWLKNIERVLFFCKSKSPIRTSRLKTSSLKILINFNGNHASYLNEIIKNLNHIEKIHQATHQIRAEDYRLLCQLFNIQYRYINQMPHRQKMNLFLKKLVTHPGFQLEKPQLTQSFYLNILKKEDILVDLKIHLIFALFMDAHVGVRHQLLEQLTTIHQHSPQVIHKVCPEQYFIKMEMANFYLKTCSQLYAIHKIKLIIYLLQDNTLVPNLSLLALVGLRNTFIGMISQTQEINLALQLGNIILKKSPHEGFQQCEFLFHRIIAEPFLPPHHKAKIMDYLMKQGMQIIEIQTYQAPLVTLTPRMSSYHH